MVRLIISIFLALLTFTNGFNKIGIKYRFKKRVVTKKFYFNTSTHKLNSISDRVFKKKTLYFNPSNLTINPSSLTGIKNSILFFADPRASTRTNYKDPVYHLRAGFKASKFMFVNIRPKNSLTLPYWARSIDFWALTNTPNIKIGIYFEYPGGVKKRSVVNLPYKRWQKRFMNLYANTNYKNNKPIKITKIRISKVVNNPPKEFSVLISPIRVYSHLRSSANQYYMPYESFADFENNKSNNWDYIINNKAVKQKISTIKSHDNQWENNKQYLALDIPISIHKNREVFIHFPFMSRLKKGHQISMWIKGDNSGQEVSAIFQDGKRRYFELVLTEIHFRGWKRITVKIPDNQIRYFRDSFSLNPYIIIAGLKLSPLNKRIELGLDRLEGVIEPSLVL